MADVNEVLRHLEQGRDPELDKLVGKRADEQGVSRREALARLLPGQAEAEAEAQ